MMFLTFRGSRRAAGWCLLAGSLLCSCSTPYRPLKNRYGYTDQPVGTDLCEVTFVANGNSTYDRALDFAMLRSAEIALDRQAKSFAVLNVIPLSSARKFRTSTQFFESSCTYLSDGRVVPLASEFTPNLAYSYLMIVPGQERIFYSPGVRLTVRFSPQAPQGGSDYDPGEVASRLKRKYGLK